MSDSRAGQLHLLRLRHELRNLREARMRWGRLVGDWLRYQAGQRDADLRVRMQRDANLLQDYMRGPDFCSDYIPDTGEPVLRHEMHAPVAAALEGDMHYAPRDEEMVAVAGLFDAEEIKLTQRIRNVEEKLEVLGESVPEPEPPDDVAGGLRDHATALGSIAEAAGSVARMAEVWMDLFSNT